MPPSLDHSQQTKLLTHAVRRILVALRGQGETRIVGGAVRDVILSRKTGDIDLATTLPPEQVADILAQHQIKTVPTGIEHGTITAVVDHVGYEITTLRRDVATDGRHAEVAFTDDWQTDAARRDFTFNALYVDSEGRLYDYFNGVEDVKAGRVRFIGDAATRIREDVLRILRFFRFYAYFGHGALDASGLAACRELATLIPRLSVERIAREIAKLLTAPNPLPAWQAMIDCGITKHVAPAATDLPRLQLLLNREMNYRADPAPLLRLAALLPQDETCAAELAARLKLSKRDAEKLRLLAKLPALFQQDLTAPAIRRALYAHGADPCREAIFLTPGNIDAARATIAAWENPTFPIKGEDIVSLGIPPGPHIGERLHAVKEWWIASDFLPDREACLEYAKQNAKSK